MRNVVAAAVACLSIVGLATAGDVQASIRKDISIPAGGLGPALQAFSAARLVHVIFISEDIGARRTKGVSGSLTVDESLMQLLDGTGLTYRYIDNETVSIVPAATTSQATSSADAPIGAINFSDLLKPIHLRKARSLKILRKIREGALVWRKSSSPPAVAKRTFNRCRSP